MSIIGIVIGVIAIGLIFYDHAYIKKDQQMTNDLVDGDIRALENGYNALMGEFTNYQIDNERKIAELEKQLEIQTKNHSTRMDKMNKSLPSVIGQVVGQIELAQDTINRQM
jgi:predicted Holliday junction resolvase-like endonuclease